MPRGSKALLRRKHHRADNWLRDLRFEELENRWVLSGPPVAAWWVGLQLDDVDEHEDDDDREERYEFTNSLSSYRADHDDDHDDDDHEEQDELWETEEARTTTALLADNLIRSAVVPVVNTVPLVNTPIWMLDDGDDDHDDHDDDHEADHDESLEPDHQGTGSGGAVTGSPTNTADGEAEPSRGTLTEPVASSETDNTDSGPADGDESAVTDEALQATAAPAAQTAGTNGNQDGSRGADPGTAITDPNRGRIAEADAAVLAETDSATDATNTAEDRIAATDTTDTPVDADPDQSGPRSDVVAHTVRRTSLPENKHMVTAAANAGGQWRLFDSIPQDLAALEQALQRLLHEQTARGRGVVEWLMDPEVLSWILASSVAAVAIEAARRKARRTSPYKEQPRDGLPLDQGQDVQMLLFPELFGLVPEAKR